MEDLSWIVDLTGSAILGVIMLAGLRWVIPRLLDHAATHLDKSHEMFTTSSAKAHETFLASVKNILEDNKEQRAHCERELSAWRAEFEQQRTHDTATSDSMWRHIRQQADEFHKHSQRLDKLIDRLDRVAGKCPVLNEQADTASEPQG